MLTHEADRAIQTLSITRSIDIAASPAIAFEAALAELGPGSEMPDGTPFPMVIEPWPGGRWYRDLGKRDGYNAGHLWGHVQVIKPPTLLELQGPMFMSYPAISHVQYRLTETPTGTTLTIRHEAIGLIDPEHREGVSEGWAHGLSRIKHIAEQRADRS
ncbi:MAG: SRPBCC family protein [Phycisphaerales bacterium]